MEGVPRMPMLSFDLKTYSEPIEFTPALKSYISEAYHENPDNYSKECTELDQLRQSAVQVTMDFVGCSVLKKYFAQLHFLQSRFPMRHGDPVVIPFTWEDSYMHHPYTVTDIEFEMASVLYNIGALHSMLGSMDSRASAEGMKVSCTHFQCSAWAFQHLRDGYDSNASPDMNHQLLSFKSYLMLAQAQECILEKSMTDNRKSSITAKVSAQIVEYYKLAMKSLDASNTSMYVGSKKTKEWKKRMELKVNFYDCITFYYLGISAEEQQKWGERITYYQAAVDKLTECSRLYGKGDADSASIGESIRFAMDVAAGKCTSAKKDNDFIYHEKIPTLDSLPEVKGASLVKGIPFNHNDPEVSGTDIFRKLVPIEAHKASSMYSEEKAKLLRQVSAKIEEKNQELSQFMSSIQLESVTQIVPEPQKLPQALVEKCAAISVRPDAIKSLTDAMQSLSGISLDVEGNIREIRALLDEEDKNNKEFQVVYGGSSVIKSSAALSELNSECAKCQEGLTKASQSNEELHRAMEIHIANLKILASPLHDLQKMLPSVSDIQRTPEDEATIKDMRRLYDKVEEMKGQRQRLEQQLREELLKDDVTAVLVTQGDKNQEEFFQEQLNKHSKTVGFIDQNLSAQDNILRAFTDVNARFAHIRKENSSVVNRRDTKINELIKSYDVYEDLMTKTNRGVQFYGKLDSTVKRLLEKTCNACKTCQEERNKILERLAPKAPPPARPTAPKPGQPQTTNFDPSLANFPVDMSGLPPTSFHQSMIPSAMPQLSAEPQPLRLKDFLPLMKPGSFGPKAPLSATGSSGNSSASIPAGSLPGSMSASPIHFAPISGSLPASPHKQLLPRVEPTGAHNAETFNSGFLPLGGNSVGAGFQPAVSVPSEEYSSFNMPNSHVNMSGGIVDGSSAGHFIPSSSAGVSGASATSNYSGTNSYATASGAVHTGRVDSGYDSASGVTIGLAGPVNTSSGNDSVRSMNSQLASTIQYPTALPQGASLPGAQFASSSVAYDMRSSQSFNPGNQGTPLNYPGQPVNPVYTGSMHTNLPDRIVNSGAVSGYHSSASATAALPPNYQTIAGGSYTGASIGHPSFVNQSSQLASGNNFSSQQPVNQLQYPPQGMPQHVPSSSYMPRQPPTQTASQFHSAGFLPANSQSQKVGLTYAPSVTTSLPYDSTFQTNNRLQQGPATVSQQMPNQAMVSSVNGSQTQFNSANQAAATFPSQYSHERQVFNHATITSAMPGQHQPRFSSDFQRAPVSTAVGQQQPGYPSTAAGMPDYMQQQGPMYSSVSQTTQRFATSNHQPGFQAPSQTSSGYMQNNNQPRYSVADRMLPPTAGQPQLNSQPNFPSNVQSGYQVTNTPAVSNMWVGSLPQSMGQPPHGYPVGSQTSVEPQYGYPMANQPLNVTQQGYQMGNQHQVHYTSTNQAPRETVAASLTNQGGVSGTMHGNYNQMYAPQNFPMQTQQQSVSGVQNVYPTFHQNVSSASFSPATSSVIDVRLPSLPSPLQPSRVSVNASNSSKNLESLKDLEFSSPANAASSASSVILGNQAVTGECKSSVDGMGVTDPLGDKLAAPSLVPKVVSTEEQRERREEEARRTLHQSRSTRDPFADTEVLTRFAAEVEKFQKLVEALVKPTLGGYLPLDKEWKDLNDEQERSSKQCMAIARCYPLKNRFPDVMPYDNSRVVLTGAADDYINASHLESLSASCPNFIATQSPLPPTFADFWQMVYDEGTETIVALCIEQEPGVKNHVYWPIDKSQNVTHGPFIISLQSIKDKQTWIERILSVTHKTTNQARSVVHLQFVSWPPAGIPDSVENLIQFVIGVQSFYLQQRSLTKPVIVHCSNGVGRTGAFCVIYAGINEIDQGNGIVQINEMISRMRRQRRAIVQYKEQLKLCYDAVLYYAQDTLRRRGILNARSTFGSGKLPAVGDRTHVRAPSDDLVLGLPSLSAIQSSVSKMSVRAPTTRASSIDSSTSVASTDAANPDMASKSDSSVPGALDSLALTPVDYTHAKQIDEHSRASSPALSTCSGSESSNHLSPQHHYKQTLADPMHLPCASGPSLANLPPSLADLQNPATFRIDPSPSTKRKITKASFFDPARPSISEGTDNSDPLSQLDPLWSLKPPNKECVNGNS